ncbi:MAG: diacylglycerol kinase family protein, partial [Patescibacteria group bacterium]
MPKIKNSDKTEKGVEAEVAPRTRPKPIRISLKDARERVSLRRISGTGKAAAARVAGPAYSYIYDTFAQEMKYIKVLREIENRLIDLGIGGRIHRLSCFKNLREIVNDDIARGIKTIVIVGNDESLIRAIDALGDADAALGFIPLGAEKENNFSKMFGIGMGTVACDILSARLLVKMDLGEVNGHYFFTNIDVPAANFFVDCDGQYKLSFLKSADVRVCNLVGWGGGGESEKLLSNPCDGLLETVVYARSESFLNSLKTFFKDDKKASRISVFYNK